MEMAMVCWWQVLAVAFRGHWAALASSGAARAAYHATALRHSATRVDHTSKQQVGGWLALNNKQEDVATTHPHEDALHKVSPKPG